MQYAKWLLVKSLFTARRPGPPARLADPWRSSSQNGPGQHRDMQGASVHDLDLDMEGPGAYGEPEYLSGILNYPSESFILIRTYPNLSHTILDNPIQSATPQGSGFVAQIHVDKSG